MQAPMQKLLWGYLLWGKGSEEERLLLLSLSPLKSAAFRRGVHAAAEGGHPPASVPLGQLCAGGAAEVQGKCLGELLPTDFCNSHVARAEQGQGSSMGQ